MSEPWGLGGPTKHLLQGLQALVDHQGFCQGLGTSRTNGSHLQAAREQGPFSACREVAVVCSLEELIRQAATSGPRRSLGTHWRSARVVLTFSAAERAAIPSSPMAFSCKLRHASAASAHGPGTREQGDGQRGAASTGHSVPAFPKQHLLPGACDGDTGWTGGGSRQSHLGAACGQSPGAGPSWRTLPRTCPPVSPLTRGWPGSCWTVVLVPGPWQLLPG